MISTRPRAAALLTALVLLLPVTAAAITPAGPAQRTLDAWAAAKGLAGTIAGVSVVCTRDGSVWGEHHADRLLIPASGAKLLTTAAALDLLPADAAWPTSAHGALDTAGAVLGDLVVVGRGDPQLMPDDLAALADALVSRGVRRVTGDLIVATGAFAPPLLPPAFDTKLTDASYRPAVSAAGCNYGAVRVVVRPARKVGGAPKVQVDPASDAVIVRNNAVTEAGKGAAALSVTATDRDDGRTLIVIDGRIGLKAGKQVVRKRVADPGVLTGHVLAAMLAKRGVALDGHVRVDPAVASSAAPRLAEVASPGLADALRDTNTWSNNSMAETIFMLLGRGPKGEPASWERAASAVADALVKRGLPAGSFAVVNGSGLYEGTKITPRAMTTLLAGFAGDDDRSRAFRDSLAVAGAPGTLEWRLRTPATRGFVRAKTGTLDEVTSLSGYAPAASGCLLAVAILINGGSAERTESLRREVDQLILSLARL